MPGDREGRVGIGRTLIISSLFLLFCLTQIIMEMMNTIVTRSARTERPMVNPSVSPRLLLTGGVEGIVALGSGGAISTGPGLVVRVSTEERNVVDCIEVYQIVYIIAPLLFYCMGCIVYACLV